MNVFLNSQILNFWLTKKPKVKTLKIQSFDKSDPFLTYKIPMMMIISNIINNQLNLK
jgi:hypothetical protein